MTALLAPVFPRAMLQFENADELRQAIRDAGGVAKVARKANVKPTTLYSFMKGDSENMRGDTQQKVVEALESFAASGVDVVQTDDPILRVPIYDLSAAGGMGNAPSQEDVIGHYPYRAEDLRRMTRSNIRHLAVIDVRGDSMEPTLRNLDRILIDMSVRDVVEDSIYVIQYRGHLLVKRCQRNLRNGAVIISSDNPTYQAFEIAEEELELTDELAVVGRAIWIARALG